MLGLALMFLLIGFNVFAADGDLIVNGSVGIGTTGPDRRLDVLDSSNPQMRLTHTDGSIFTDLQTTSSGHLYVNPSGGRIGIGTTSPAEMLDVVKSATGNSIIQITNSVSGSAAQALFKATTDEGSVFFGASGSGHSNPKALVWSGIPNRDLVFAVNNAEKMRITSGGNIGIGTASPGQILTVLEASVTDPIADTWISRECSRTTKDVIRTLPNQSGALDQLLGIELYEWKRKPLVSDDEIKSQFGEDIPPDELEKKRLELSAEKSGLPKFQAKRLGIMLDDPNIPDEIVALDGAGNKKGIDLVGYIGWLHATIKELALRVQELEKK